MIISRPKNENGPASVGALPSRGSTNPQKDTEMNEVMNTTARPQAPDFSPEEVKDLREMASIDWTPWKGGELPNSPNRKKWDDAFDPHIIMTIIGYAAMQMDREQLVAKMEAMERDGLFDKGMDNLDASIEFFQNFHDMLWGVKARFMAAGAVVALREMGELA